MVSCIVDNSGELIAIAGDEWVSLSCGVVRGVSRAGDMELCLGEAGTEAM